MRCAHACCQRGRELWADLVAAYVAYQADRSLLTLGPYRRAMDAYLEHELGGC
jgi:hypothetical protein